MKLWNRTIGEILTDLLRSVVWCVLVANGILLSLLSLWFTYHLVLHLKGWCARTIFSGEW